MSDVYDVAIVGGGPAGLAAAMALRKYDIERVIVLERMEQAGGIPRTCGHPPFGMREFGRILTGPAYASRLAEKTLARGAEISTSTTVQHVADEGEVLRLTLIKPEGVTEITARRAILATGVRETTRAARLFPGERPLGVINTGALQNYAYLERRLPFKNPVIFGTELVSLSALLTCRHMGVKPVAMIEQATHSTVRAPMMVLPRLTGVPVHYGLTVSDIIGRPRVNAIEVVNAAGVTRQIACDGAVITGKFVPEVNLATRLGIAMDAHTGGPEIDQFGRTTNPRIFAAGNVLHPVETAGWCYREGSEIAEYVAASLHNELPVPEPGMRIEVGEGVKYAVPQRLVAHGQGMRSLQLRLSKAVNGRLWGRSSTHEPLFLRGISGRPEQRLLVNVKALPATTAKIEISTDSTSP